MRSDPLAVGVLLVVAAMEPHVAVEGGDVLELAAADRALDRAVGGGRRDDCRGRIAALRFCSDFGLGRFAQE